LWADIFRDTVQPRVQVPQPRVSGEWLPVGVEVGPCGLLSSEGVYALVGRALCVVVGNLVVAKNRASTNVVQPQLSAPFERGSDHGRLVGAGGVTHRGRPCTYPTSTPSPTPPTRPPVALQMEEHLAAEALRGNCPAGVDVLLTHSCGASEQGTGLTSAVAGLAPRSVLRSLRAPFCVRAPLCTHSMIPPMTLLCHCPLCLGVDP
jgi:hypothetical protein